MKKFLSAITICLLFVINAYSFTQIVTVQNHLFTPSGFTINLGDTVRFTWLNGSHTTTSLIIPAGAASWDHPINSSSTSFTYIPSKIGVYNYKCIPHFSMGMKGNFTVVCPQPSVQISADGSVLFCKGESVLLKSSVTSAITFYQWKKDGTNIANAKSSTYTATVTASYTLMVTNSCGNSATSNAINVKANPLPQAIITPSDTVLICKHDSVMMQATTGASQTYQWQKNGSNIAGATASSYTAKTAGKYRVNVTKTTTGCSKQSAVTRVIIQCPSLAKTNSIVDDNAAKIFPNPSAGSFHISIPSYNDGKYFLTIFDVNGKQVVNSNIISKDYSFGNELTPGIYLVQVRNDNKVILREKIIKE
ncbi:MAG: T9SS type A sorting domain-containing protein [Parafilimonas sp.]